jgi:prevent-host-death family protein
MTNRVGISELRQQASAILRRVAAGEVVEVTDRGRPIARIVPLKLKVLDQLVLHGRATERVGDLLSVMEELGLPVPTAPGSQPPSQAVAELRTDGR